MRPTSRRTCGTGSGRARWVAAGLAGWHPGPPRPTPGPRIRWAGRSARRRPRRRRSATRHRPAARHRWSSSRRRRLRTGRWMCGRTEGPGMSSSSADGTGAGTRREALGSGHAVALGAGRRPRPGGSTAVAPALAGAKLRIMATPSAEMRATDEVAAPARHGGPGALPQIADDPHCHPPTPAGRQRQRRSAPCRSTIRATAFT